MNFEKPFGKYRARILTENDVSAVLALYKGNGEYFEHCPPKPDEDAVRDDMAALPPGKTKKDKLFLGFFENGRLVAVTDLILKYPDEKTAFLGLLMVEKAFQGKGTGSALVCSLLERLKEDGFCRVRLGVVETNLSARAFWLKNSFCPTGKEKKQKLYTVVEFEKEL